MEIQKNDINTQIMCIGDLKPDKKAVLVCKCKLCGSKYYDDEYIYPQIRINRIGSYLDKLVSTHDCSKGDNPILDAFGYGEPIGIVFK